MSADDGGHHSCPGPGCKKKIPYHMLACRRHWYQVSPATRRRVWHAWQGGLGAGTVQHTEAMDLAISEMKP